MKVSRKAYYGLRAVLALAETGQPLSIHSLARTEQLPEDYLEKIFQRLRQAGIVEAKKGASGGYALAQPSGQLNVWDVLRVLDGPVRVFAPPIKNALPCFQPSHCQTNQVWRTLYREIEKTLKRIRIAQVVTGGNEKAKAHTSH